MVLLYHAKKTGGQQFTIYKLDTITNVKTLITTKNTTEGLSTISMCLVYNDYILVVTQGQYIYIYDLLGNSKYDRYNIGTSFIEGRVSYYLGFVYIGPKRVKLTLSGGVFSFGTCYTYTTTAFENCTNVAFDGTNFWYGGGESLHRTFPIISTDTGTATVTTKSGGSRYFYTAIGSRHIAMTQFMTIFRTRNVDGTLLSSLVGIGSMDGASWAIINYVGNIIYVLSIDNKMYTYSFNSTTESITSLGSKNLSDIGSTTATLFGGVDGMVVYDSPACVAEDTLVTTKFTGDVKITDIKEGDILSDGGIVTSVIKSDVVDYECYKFKDLIVTGKHKIIDKDEIKEAKDVEGGKHVRFTGSLYNIVCEKEEIMKCNDMKLLTMPKIE